MDADWAAVRNDFEAGDMTLNAIAARYGVHRAAILKRARTNKWNDEERDAATERRVIIEELFWALERQARHLGEVELAGFGEKEAAVLSKLATSLDRLLALDTRANKPVTPKESRELAELRRRIGNRLEELKVR